MRRANGTGNVFRIQGLYFQKSIVSKVGFAKTRGIKAGMQVVRIK